MKPIACNICGPGKTKTLFQKGKYRLVQCTGCELAYIDPQPGAAELADYYQGRYGEVYIKDKKKIRSKFMDAKRDLWRLKGLGAGAPPSLLDVGCSFGYLIKTASDAGWRAVGLDPSQWAVEHARKEFSADAREGDLLTFDGKGAPFDIVTMYDSLEHTLDPRKNLEQAFRFLRPGGFLVVAIPDFGHYKARKQGPDWGPFIPPEHLFYFSESSLIRLCRAAGFRHAKSFFRFPNRDTLKSAFFKPDA